jgi:hypothetical protein
LTWLGVDCAELADSKSLPVVSDTLVGSGSGGNAAESDDSSGFDSTEEVEEQDFDSISD